MIRVLFLAAASLAFCHGGSSGLSNCPGSATVTVFVDNLSDAPSVDVALDGALAADAATCLGGGAVSYENTMTCTGSGLVRCGQIGALQPGAWVHRLGVTVPDSARQEQAQRLVLVAGDPTQTSNALVWTVYPQTYVVQSTVADGPDGLPDPDGLPAKLDQATAYTLCNPGLALITFAPAVFPGASDPKRIDLVQPTCGLAARNQCRPTLTPDRCPCQLGAPPDGCSLSGDLDGGTAGLCVAGDRIVVDALDRDAEPGGVILSVATCGRQVLRLYGGDDTFRGVVFEGSQKSCTTSNCATYCRPPTCTPSCHQVDTVTMTGPRARRDRIEQSTVLGPSCGDTVSADNGAGQPDDRPGDDVVARSELRGGEDKGVKVDFGASAIVEESCVHDNRNGGIQSTLGGHITAIENVVQHNVPGAAQNGLSVKGGAGQSTLVTEGNVIRLNGGRGLSVTDNAMATFMDDYVADNQYAGSKVETTAAALGTAPFARFHGVALVCNRHAGLSGLCSPSPTDVERPCTMVEDCCINADESVDAMCVATSQCLQGTFPAGFGAAMSQATGKNPPDIGYGDTQEAGRNVFTNNKNTTAGANFRVNGVASTIPAFLNQWEHCPMGAPCDVTEDISPPDAMVDVGPITDPRATDEFQLLRVTPPRPQTGDIVRVYGRGFDAISGNPSGPTCGDLVTCFPDGTCPTGPCVNGTCPCSVENAAVQQQNQQTVANRIRFKTRDGLPVTDNTATEYFYPDAVTPTMLAFRMPFDCFAPLTLEVTKHDATMSPVTVTIPLCDPTGCQDAPADFPCDDGNACTGGDHCSGTGDVCVSGDPIRCGGGCQTGRCDPVGGCEVTPAGTLCRAAAGPCDAPETCDGVAADCPPDRFKPDTETCDDGNACTVGDHCTGVSGVCAAGSPVVCDGTCLTGTCDPQLGCRPKEGLQALTCRVDECRRRRLHRKLQHLATLVDHALNTGVQPHARIVERLTKLLTRCGVSIAGEGTGAR